MRCDDDDSDNEKNGMQIKMRLVSVVSTTKVSSPGTSYHVHERGTGKMDGDGVSSTWHGNQENKKETA